jgi:predicted esterase
MQKQLGDRKFAKLLFAPRDPGIVKGTSAPTAIPGLKDGPEMKLHPWLPALVLPAALAFAQQPPKATAPPAETLKAIAARADKLATAIEALRRKGVGDPFLADVEIYHKAATWITRHNEFYQKDAADWTLAVLDRGLLRASQQARGESPWFQETGHAVVRAYRSAVDGSVQPYAVTFPADYGKNAQKKWRLDVVLHGRNDSLTEVVFLHQHNGDKPAPKEQDWVQIDIFGRGNNAYRWAGETDVFEAVENFLAVETGLRRVGLLDPTRMVLRGFSMGGAGTWHLGLHRPDRWTVIGPGAGFTTTHGYVANLPEVLPPYQEACLRIYDAVDYAENAADVPVVAYAGADDKQLQAAQNIQAKLKPLGIPMTLLVAPGLGHRFPPEWQKKAEEEYAKHLAKGKPEYPKRVHFVTYTLKYPSCFWVNLLALERHYQRSLVEAEQADAGFTVKTENVRILQLALPPGADQGPTTVAIDGQRLEHVVPYQRSTRESLYLYLEKRAGKWATALPERLFTEQLRRPWKGNGLQGPIDDAFMGPFLCVRGTGKPWHEATQTYAEASLQRFQKEWSRYLRGEVPVKDDRDVTPEDMASHHLVLFGDPSSNRLLAEVLPDLPLQWTREKITWGGKEYAAGEHVPVMIYPSPLNKDRYVVLNSGHTFHAADFQGTNALLYPRLGDYAILKVGGKNDPLAAEVQTAGLFDDFWRVVPTAKPGDGG